LLSLTEHLFIGLPKIAGFVPFGLPFTNSNRGVHPPEAMMHFPPLFSIFPLKIFRLWKFSKMLSFQKKFPIFSRQISYDLFFSHRPQISDSPPILPVLVHFPSDSRKFIIFPLTLRNFPSCFRKIHQLFTYFTCIFPPTLTMMHLCITQCTYWTPLNSNTFHCSVYSVHYNLVFAIKW